MQFNVLFELLMLFGGVANTRILGIAQYLTCADEMIAGVFKSKSISGVDVTNAKSTLDLGVFASIIVPCIHHHKHAGTLS